MGVHVSKNTAGGAEDQKKSKQLDQMLQEEKRKANSVFRLLLLGAGDSGKSTVIKQMKILHANGFKEEDLQIHRLLVEGNIVQSISAIVNAMDTLNIKYGCAEREVDAKHVANIEAEWSSNHERLNASDWTCLKRLWQDDGVQACFIRSAEYQLSDSTKYFCDDMDRISAVDFVPNVQDILHTRVATAGIVEMSFTLRGLTLNVIDVGGQRSQRKKWIHCFENINAIIFVASLSEYNQSLMEDVSVNRMQESVRLFQMVVNSQWFMRSSVVLFLNKKDLFAEKIQQHPLKDTFPDYKDGANYEAASDYVQQLYQRQKLDPDKSMYTHKTCATDTKNIDFVLESCFDILLQRNLAKSGLL